MDKKFTRFILFLIFYSLFCINVSSQNTDEPAFSPLIDDIILKLPSLQTLIDSAVANSPKVRYQDATIGIFKLNVEIAKIDYLRNFVLQAGWGMANYYNYSLNETSSSAPTEFLSNRDESRYNIGAYINFPIIDFFDQKSTVKRTKLEMEQAYHLRDERIMEIRQTVITLYEQVVLRQKTLKIMNENQQTTTLQVKMGEFEFLSGKISISDWSRLIDINSRGQYNFEEEISRFKIAYLLLEDIVGMKFNLLNQLD